MGELGGEEAIAGEQRPAGGTNPTANRREVEMGTSRPAKESGQRAPCTTKGRARIQVGLWDYHFPRENYEEPTNQGCDV